MAVPVVAYDTRGAAARGGSVSLHRMQTQLERLEYLAEKMPRFSDGLARRRENATCRYIRDHLFPLLDEDQQKKVVIARKHYELAMGMGEEPDGLRPRVEMLGHLLEKAQREGKIEGEDLGAWERTRLEGEALVLKKRGTAALVLFVNGQESECACLSEKSLQAALERWERLESRGNDHAKALYWLALAKYSMGKDEEAVECAQKCMEMCKAGEGLDWLYGNAKDVLARAKIELNRERLMC